MSGNSSTWERQLTFVTERALEGTKHGVLHVVRVSLEQHAELDSHKPAKQYKQAKDAKDEFVFVFASGVVCLYQQA